METTNEFNFKGSLVECVEVPLEEEKPSVYYYCAAFCVFTRSVAACGENRHPCGNDICRQSINNYFVFFLFRQWLFLSDTNNITRLLLPWRPCLDSKL